MKYLILVGILLFLILSKSYEYFNNSIHFINVTDSNDVFEKINIENYINKLRTFELHYKTKNNTTSHQLIKNDYINAVMNFTNNEINYISQLINEITNDCFTHFKEFKEMKWNLVKLDNNIEWAMPFTMGEYIFIPKSRIDRLMNNNSLNMISSFKVMLVHEKIHIFQRKYQELFNNFYEKHFHCKRKHIHIHNEIGKYILSNPDAMDIHWYFTLYNKNYIPLLMLNKYNPDDVYNDIFKLDNNFNILLDHNNKPITLQKSVIKNIFGNYYGLYHPNEIFAYITADIIVKKNTKNTSNYIEKSINDFINQYF